MSATFKVGDRVGIPLGRRKLSGVITEDRGAIGVRGRHLYQIRIFMDPDEPMTFEIPEDEIEATEEPAGAETILENKKIVEFLVHGGLIAILRSNHSGGRNQPRVWLRPDSVGNVTYTFEEQRGVVGGEVVPFWASQDDKIVLVERDKVLSFLQSFHLNRQEAERVISSIGTAP